MLNEDIIHSECGKKIEHCDCENARFTVVERDENGCATVVRDNLYYQEDE